MPRKGRKNYDSKRKDKRDKLREQRLKQAGELKLVCTDSQSVTSLNCPKQNQSVNSLNCPIKQDQSVNSKNCPIKPDQSDNSINCPIKPDQSINSINCPIQSDQSVNSINCPIQSDQSVNSINCPIQSDQSVNSINCPIIPDQSVNSINCPIQSDQSVNSINCPIQSDQSVNSINCPIQSDQSVNSINCPIQSDQSVNSINCPIKPDQSINSINCPIQSDQSVNSINCPIQSDQSVNSIDCPIKPYQSANSINCLNGTELFKLTELTKSKESMKLKQSIRSNKSINEMKSTKSFIANKSIKISQSLKSTMRSNLFAESVEINLESEAMDLNMDSEAMDLNLDSKAMDLNLDSEALDLNMDSKAMDLNMDSEAMYLNLDSKAMDLNLDSETMDLNMDSELVRLNLDSESIRKKFDAEKANQDYEATYSNLDSEAMDLNLDSVSDEISLDFQATKFDTDSESLMLTVNCNGKCDLKKSNLHDTIEADSDYRNTSSDTKMKQMNIQKNKRFEELVDKSIIIETDNTQLASNSYFVIDIEQENDGLKMYSHKNKGTITENSIEVSHVSRSVDRNFVVQGSFHQGDIRFGINSGKQCVANCLSALAHSKFKSLKDWDQMYIDNVLIKGNQIYSNIHGDNVHLLVSDLPGMIEMSGKLLKISRKESITAVIDNYGTIDFSEFGNSLPLDQALQESLIDYDACFICAYDTTFLALKHNQDLVLFDSHARNKFGLQDSDGKSLLLKLNNLDHLYQYCCNMVAGSSQNQWFEVTGVSICIENCIDSDQVLESYNKASTSNSQLSYNQEKENKNSHEIIKTPDNLSMHDHISPEILKSNICSNESFVTEKNNEVHIDDGITDNESDVEIMSTINNFYDFKPLNTDSKRKLCIIAKIPTKNISKKITPKIHIMGPPSATKTITGDGNCLFRAISYALSNRQEFFGNVRKAIVDHLMTNTEIFRSFLQPQFVTVEQHIQTLKMEEKNVWGTELEILACADLLKTDIYTFYNVVTNVTRKSHSPNPLQFRRSCAEKFQDDKSEITAKKMKLDENQITGSIYNLGDCNTESKVISKAEKERIKYWTDDKFRTRKTYTLKRKYWENEEIRSKKLCLGIRKYEKNEKYRENLIQAGIEKYQDDEEYRDVLIKSGIQKYQEDPEYREKLKEASIEKYKSDMKSTQGICERKSHKK
ncbi:Hypothetical predicted protein [Mytilus galloprovincialis]|uniref:OTU domain-containing protein n=1 Tax=Mytilus galloprovincialis TaxID=29158 RepID=A0A8B6G5Q3_MYTGA|nr:Hypothetical predicted protein [Mytilus galloprovincialis]